MVSRRRAERWYDELDIIMIIEQSEKAKQAAPSNNRGFL